MLCLSCVDRDGSVNISTCSLLDGLGIGSRWGARFSAPVQTQLPIQWVLGIIPGGKEAGAWR